MLFVIFVAVAFAAVFLALGYFALFVKIVWPFLSKSEEPDLHDAFRYAGITFVILLLVIFRLLIFFLPGPQKL